VGGERHPQVLMDYRNPLTAAQACRGQEIAMIEKNRFVSKVTWLGHNSFILNSASLWQISLGLK
jgi:hypothetical protein